MDLKFLDFEQPIAELEAKIEELRFVGDDSEININEEVARLRSKSEALTKSIFAKLSAWQIAWKFCRDANEVPPLSLEFFLHCGTTYCLEIFNLGFESAWVIVDAAMKFACVFLYSTHCVKII